MVLHPFHSKMRSSVTDVLMVKVGQAIRYAYEAGNLDATSGHQLMPMPEWSAILEARKAALYHKGHLPEDLDWLGRLGVLTTSVDLRTAFDVKRQCVRVPHATWLAMLALVEELQTVGDREPLRRVWIIETMIEMGIKPEDDAINAVDPPGD